jgi:signal transduction histidine kinase
VTHPSLPSDSSLDSTQTIDVRDIGLRDGDALLDPERLAAVRATGLLDSEVEEVFDRLTRLAVRLLGIPAAFISLVDAGRDFYKSTCGFGEPLASARELTGPTFCHYTIQRTTPLVIPDTAADPVYRNVPTVRSLGVAAYVGVPLIVGGQAIGAFCAIDMQPHAWTDEEVEVLVELAASANREVELRGAIATGRAAFTALEAQARELRTANLHLQEQATELAAQADELEAQADELQAAGSLLEERTEEAEAARGAAEVANKSKAQFLTNMSHELRTPLNAIGGYAELLELGINGPVTAEQLVSLDRIRRSQRHLLGLINGILNYAKIGAGSEHYEVENVAIDEILATCEALVAPQVRERQLELRHERCDTPLIVRADREKAQQVVTNLLSNALKFTEPGGRITMECSQAGGITVILVTDTGHGIAADQLERVFQPFVQVDADLTRTKEGTGLGLAISRELARGMNGDLTAQSTPGVGSTFILTLPSAEQASQEGTVS